MSVLNQSGEEQVECPLCMEPLEVDDLNFFPCTCGYQICRFCWHRIRTDENGLCPACRKAYSENPADFTPLSKEQVAQLKAEKRQRDQQRKAKLSESRKHLASVRVVQRNLVFVVGLPLRLADAEVLKRHEYFGKFGKIHKVVINQSTAYAGSQGPSASAYVTYMKSDDALRAIQSVNNISLDGRQIKSSLGTTKYCSHFMKNQPCPKPDCMYLHDFGDPEASFTKEQMHAGKHQEYEKKLHEVLLQKMAAQNKQDQLEVKQQTTKIKEQSQQQQQGGSSTANGKETWPQLNAGDKGEKITEKKSEKVDKEKTQRGGKNKTKSGGGTDSKRKNCDTSQGVTTSKLHQINMDCNTSKHDKVPASKEQNLKNRNQRKDSESSVENSVPKLSLLDDNTSFFSQNSFQKLVPDIEQHHQNEEEISNLDNSHSSQILNDSLPDINSCEDWEAAFGFTKHSNHLEELAQQRNSVKDTLETFSNNSFGSLGMGLNQNDSLFVGKLDGFNHVDGYTNSSYDFKTKLFDNLNKNSNQFAQSIPFKNLVQANLEERLHGQYGLSNHSKEINGLNGLNGVDHMSKFFTDFYKNGQKDLINGLSQNGLSQGLNGMLQSNNFLHSLADKQMLLLQQKQIEDQLMMLSMKPQSLTQSQQQQQQQQQQFLHNNHFVNGDVMPQNGQSFGPLHSQIYRNSSLPISKHNIRTNAEDELDFDPFQETQKALAELIENEQSLKIHTSVHNSVPTSQMNGLIHNQSGNAHLPPPPPGFIQPHMNSFGSKILPYLNMNSQQQINNTSQNWPSSYNLLQPQQQQQQPQHQQQQHKGLGVCNDWKVLDPAIVSSSSRYFSIANVGPHRDQFNALPQIGAQQQQQQNGPIRNSYDYPPSNSSFSNLNQIQPSYNNYSHINSQQNLHWLGSELNPQISSPPGFRSNNQATKQQEC